MVAPVRCLIITACLFFIAAPAFEVAARDSGKSPPPDAAMIISRARVAAAGGDLAHAVELYSSVSRLFPDDRHVPDALWQAAELSRRLGESAGANTDWAKVRTMYRDFVVAAPESPRLAAAYLEIARINNRMRLFPEARSYLRLVAKKYPRSSLIDEVWFLRARVEMEMGRYGLAEEYARKLLKTTVAKKRVRATMLLAEILIARGRLSRAVALVRGVESKLVPGSGEFIDAFRIKGRAQILMADPAAVRKGRDNLFYYLNMVDNRQRAIETRLLLAEGFFKEKNYPAAKQLLTMVVKEVDPDSLSGIRARFRLAMIRDLGLAAPPPSDKSHTWESAADDIFLKVIRRMDRKETGQAARYVLMRRMLVRGDDDGAYAQGRAYLVSGGGPWQDEVLAAVAAILDRRYSAWLLKKEYARVYENYRMEYPVIKMYRNGRLLFLVGRALENMGLYDQASVVYYRALGLKLRAADRDDLYLHRARTYLAAGDLKAATRLLKYLRGKYPQGAVGAEVLYLSGRLCLLENRRDAAMKMLDAAFELPGKPDTLAGLIRAAAPALIRLNRLDQLDLQLEHCSKVKCFPPVELQGYYVRLADAYRRHHRDNAAEKAYRLAVALGGQDTDNGSKAAFYLGSGIGGESGEKMLATVAAAKAPLWSSLARAEGSDIRIKKLAAETSTTVR